MSCNFDRVEKLDCGALIQHGKYNNRIYLMKENSADPKILLMELTQKAEKEGYSKIFAKLHKSKSEPFLNAGYKLEAEVPKFYSGKDDAVFLGYYLSAERQNEKNLDELNKVLELAESKRAEADSVQIPALSADFAIRECYKNDTPRMAEIYKKVFESYPFPIHEPEYLLETIDSHVDYYGIEFNGELIAISSAEKDVENKNAEMTDFATIPEFRGKGFAKQLLAYMEKYSKKKGIVTAYTIARAVSPGMNITFARNGYQYGGRLIKNTDISGSLESMNIWYKSI